MAQFPLRVSCAVLLSLLSLASLLANGPLRPLRTETPPVIDGRLDDPVWQAAPFVTGFKTFTPDYGHDMPETTYAYMAYDSENLYFAFLCLDPDPATIKAEITARDNIRPHDWVCINLDSFDDQQAMYALYVNPFGIQMDTRFAAGNEDPSVDLVWYSAGRITDEGYSIEIQIPLKSLRYADTNPVEMSVIFERKVSRRSEQATFPPLDPRKGFAFLTQTAPLLYHDIAHYTLFEVLPAVTYRQNHIAREGLFLKNDQRGDLSLTAKYGITSDLILDATYNPDFSQVEADAGQVDVNLRSGLFFAEKRPFFLEGSEIFNISGTNGFPSDVLSSVVHTRTIGNPVVGLKLSGKLSSRSTLAAIYAVDDLGQGTGKAHIPILRYKHSLSEDGYIGAVATSREHAGKYNRIAGTDGYFRLGVSNTIEYHGLLSQTRPGNSLPENSGHAAAIIYRYGTRDLDYRLGAQKVSEHFAAETGFLTRTGILSLSGAVKPKFFPQSPLSRRIDLELVSTQTRDDASRRWETYNELGVTNVFRGSLSVRFRYFHADEIFLGERFATSGFLASGGGQFTREFNLSLQYRRGKSIFFSAAPFQGISNRFTASMTYQPWNQFEANLSITHTDFRRESDGELIYDYPIGRVRLTYQFSRYLFLRGILEYNKFRRTLLNDGLVSFTYIPGTVLHAGYGALYQRVRWENSAYVDDGNFLETRRGFFFKMSYLWRM